MSNSNGNGKGNGRSKKLKEMARSLPAKRDELAGILSQDIDQLQTRPDCNDAAPPHEETSRVAVELAEEENKQLERIAHAIQRKRNGKYGICEDCKKAIPLARMQALPYATRCIKCQREQERNGNGQV